MNTARHLRALRRWVTQAPERVKGVHHFTVVTQAHNDGPALLDTLISVSAQDYPSARVEHLVVDGSSDRTVTKAVEGFAALHPDRHIRALSSLPPHIEGIAVELPAGQDFDDPRALDDLNARPVKRPKPEQRPLVSVVMPAFNEERYIEAAVSDCLKQTYPKLEVVVVDDGSTDRTPEILAQLARMDDRVRVVRQDNQGIVGALNRGMAEAQGELVARMDANDRVPLHRIETQVDYLEAHPDVAIVGTWMEGTTEAGQPLGRVWQTPVLPAEVAWALHFSNAIVHASIVAKTQVFRDAGLYRADGVLHLEDYDLWARLLPTVRMANIPEVLYERRELAAGITFSQQTAQQTGSQAVARRLTERLLDRPLSPEDAAILASLQYGGPIDVPKAVHLLETMQAAFFRAFEPSPTERDRISFDVARRLFRLTNRPEAEDWPTRVHLLRQAAQQSPALGPIRAGRALVRRMIRGLRS